MKVSFLVFLSFFLVILQTTILPEFSFFGHLFDLIIINILYVSLFFSHPAVIFIVIFIGVVMDSISGSPFGFYVSAYIWMYIMVKALKQYVFPTSFFIMPIVAVLALLIEHFFLIVTVFILHGKKSVMVLNYSLMAEQLVWAFFVIPVAIRLIFSSQEAYENFGKRIAEKERMN